MVEANPIKFYFAKYFFLVFGAVLLVLAVSFFMLTFELHEVAAAILFTMAFVQLYFFLIVNDKIKRVAIGKNKLVVIDGHRNVRFAWPEIKSLRIIPILQLYRVRIKGVKKAIYFFPSKGIDPTFRLLAKGASRIKKAIDKKKSQS